MTNAALFLIGLILFALLPMTGQDYLIGIGFTLLTWIALTQSWTILSGFAGYISLGHVVFFGLGGYFVVLTWETLPYWLSLPLASLITFTFAIAVSIPVLRVRGPYFVILTFGLAEFVKYVVMAVEAYLGQFGRLMLGVPSLTTLVLDHIVSGRNCHARNVLHSKQPAGSGPDRDLGRRGSGGSDRHSGGALQVPSLRAVSRNSGCDWRIDGIADQLFRAAASLRSRRVLHHSHDGHYRRQR